MQSPRPADKPSKGDEPKAEDAAPTGWWRFSGPYPVVLMDRALHVKPRQRVEFGEAAPPNTTDWSPCEAPAHATAGDGDASEES